MNKRIKELAKQADKLATEENKYYNFAETHHGIGGGDD